MIDFITPLSVPKNKRSTYRQNFKIATKGTGKLLLFAADQKVEHLNDDFFGAGITPEDASPEHLFQVAAGIPGAVMAAHIGLLARYGGDYRHLPFILKINGKSPLDKRADDLFSGAWLSSEQIEQFTETSGLNIVGLGHTIILGSTQEAKMLKQASKVIQTAHELGLLAIIWMYPRNASIKNEEDVHLVAGGAGVAACLGADFVKVKYPYKKFTDDKKTAAFSEVTKAAGRTSVICVGGSKLPAEELLKHLGRQLKNGTKGLAIGRNLHQRSLSEATALGNALSAMIHKDVSASEAIKLFKGNKTNAKKANSHSPRRVLGLF
ncbi:MAG: aldolase [bacterium]|nr:aldolase [bacterium]